MENAGTAVYEGTVAEANLYGVKDELHHRDIHEAGNYIILRTGQTPRDIVIMGLAFLAMSVGLLVMARFLIWLRRRGIKF
jgi:hypothetical protein